MNYKRVILVSLSSGELILILFVGYRIYLELKQRGNVLGRYVTRINRNSVIFPKLDSFPFYYEQNPNFSETVKPDWLPYATTYTYNTQGLRATKEYLLQKESNIYRIIALGDSFTFGQYVDEKDIYVNRLENLLNSLSCQNGQKFEIINLGVPGYDIRYEVERFRRRGQQYNPDLVIWLINNQNFYQVNDLFLPLEDKIEQETSKEDAAKFYAQNRFYFAYAQAQTIVTQKYGLDYIFSLQRQAFHTFSSLYTGPVLINMFSDSTPQAIGIASEYVKRRPQTYLNDTITPVQLEDNTALRDGHPSPKGQAMIAGQIFQYMKDSHIVSCD